MKQKSRTLFADKRILAIDDEPAFAGGGRHGGLNGSEETVNKHTNWSAWQHVESVRTDFYAKVIHDLRSPTGAILTSMELLHDEEYGPLTSEQRELVDITRMMAEKLYYLIDGYLDFARMESGYLQLETSQVDLRDAVTTSTRLIRLQCEKKGQTLQVDLPPEPLMATIDEARFQQVIDNLFNNAIKYTDHDGRIIVRLRRDNGQALLSVIDTGQGIPKKELPNLFSKYHRVPGSPAGHIQGFGLGLFIAREIVEAHGGVITAESDGIPGKGSTFTVRMPIDKEFNRDGIPHDE